MPNISKIEKYIANGWKAFKNKDLLSSFKVLGSGTARATKEARRLGRRAILRSASSIKTMSAVGAGKKLSTARNILKSNSGALNKSAAKSVWYGNPAGGSAQSRVGLRTGLQQYFWPSAGPQSYWKGTRSGHIAANKVGITRLRRTGGAALGAWAGMNMMRPGDNIGPF